MQLTIQCPQCGAQLRAEEEHLGQAFPCPKCGQAVPVQRPHAEPSEEIVEIQSVLATPQPTSLSPNFGNAAKPYPHAKPASPRESGRSNGALVVGVLSCGALLFFSLFGLLAVLWLRVDNAQVANKRGRDVAAPVIREPERSGPLPHGLDSASSRRQDARDQEGQKALAAIERSILDDLRAKTVFVQVKSGQSIRGGAGFLVQRDGESGVVATSAELVGSSARGKHITCFFHSGLTNQSSVDATMIGSDSSFELALLRVEHAGLPSPPDWKTSVRPAQRMPILALGFPTNAGFPANGRGPVLTASKGLISELRRERITNRLRVEVREAINSFNAGGPVVNEKGELIGVSVAQGKGADIGYVVGKKTLDGALRGRIESIQLKPISSDETEQRLQITTRMIDPLNSIVSATFLRCSDAGLKKPKPNAKGEWKQIRPVMEETMLSITRPSSASPTANAVLEKPTEKSTFQIRFKLRDGHVWYSQPKSLEIMNPPPLPADRSNQLRNARPRRDHKTGRSIQIQPLFGSRDGLVEHMVWSRDQAAVFVLTKSGELREIDVETGDVTNRMDFDSTASFLGRSKEGLVIGMQAKQQVWSLNEQTLAVQQKSRIKQARRIACGPSSPMVYVANSSAITAVDLRTGASKELRAVPGAKAEGFSQATFRFLTMSPNGKYLFAQSGIEALTRIAIGKEFVTVEEYSERIGTNTQDVVVSSDSRYVAMPAGGGNGVGYKTNVYAAYNLSAPIVEINSGANPRRIAFDRKSKLVYAQNNDWQLIMFDMEGSKLGEFGISSRNRGKGGDVKRFLSHPQGNRLCVLTENQLFVVDVSVR